jgi:hypothetical protein
VPGATHETVTYFFAELAPPVLTWLSEKGGSESLTNARPEVGKVR